MNERTIAKVTSPVAVQQRNYPEHQWWVAATTADVGERPVQRWILGLPVVLYRRTDGRVVALDGRCPHRWAPLAMGRVVGDDIVCGYHGFRFGPDGRCTQIPTQDRIPALEKVRSYPVMETAPFVWIWTGDPAEAANGQPPPDLSWAADENRVTARGAMEIACNHMALQENVLDLSHFAYVHANTLAVMDWVNPPKMEKTEAAVSYRQIFENAPLPAHYGVPTGIGCERAVRRDSWGTYMSPALVIGGVDITDPQPGRDGRRNYAFRVCHATTPIDEGRCYYWWCVSQDYGHGEGAAAKLTERITAAFEEDREILEATERLVRRDVRGRNYPEISVVCDQVGWEARRRLQAMLEQDRALIERAG